MAGGSQSCRSSRQIGLAWTPLEENAPLTDRDRAAKMPHEDRQVTPGDQDPGRVEDPESCPALGPRRTCGGRGGRPQHPAPTAPGLTRAGHTSAPATGTSEPRPHSGPRLPAAMPTPRALLREEGCWRWGRKRAPGLRPGRQGGRRTRGADPAPRRSPAHCQQQIADTSTAQADGRTAPRSPHPAAPTPQPPSAPGAAARGGAPFP